MEGKLIKLGLSEGYRLDDLNGNYIASTLNGKNKLSLKNCEVIADGYDLDELAREACDITDPLRLDSQKYKQDPYFKIGFNKGFQKALELLGDKKFSEKDIERAFIQEVYTKTEIHRKKEEYIQSLQQTEWDVEVCCQNDCYGDYTTCKKSSFECQICTNTGIPKLDSNGCLILKRK